MVAPPLRHWPRLWWAPNLYSRLYAPAAASTTTIIQSHLAVSPSHPCFFPSSSSAFSTFGRSSGFQPRALRRAGAPSSSVNEKSDEEGLGSDGSVRKSRNQNKREARRAVKWGMDIAEFSPTQIKRILRVASLDNEVYDALMLAKRLGPDVREGKRRQFNYIGKLLRDARPELMDTLIQASKDNDNNKLQALAGQPEEIWTDEDDDLDEEETDSEECQNNIDMADRWFHGLVYKDASISSEVYSIHNVEFDRQELRKLVRRVQTIDQAGIIQGDDGETENMALTKAKHSLLIFLRRLAKQMLIAS